MMSATKKYVFSQEILLVFKHSRLAFAKEFSKKNDILMKSLELSHEENLRTIEEVEKQLHALKLPYHVVSRNKLIKEDTDNRLVIAIGGDGTVLDVSHYCEKAVLLGVNSDPDQSVGALCAATKENFPKIIREIIRDESKITELARMNIAINDQPLDILALNDVLFCHKNPSFMSRYILYQKNIASEQRSSGVWISTPSGSTAGIFSAGGKLQDLKDNRLQFMIREPYYISKSNGSLHGFIEKDQKLSIKSAITEGVLFVDGPHQKFPVPFGSIIDFYLADLPLNVLYGDVLNERKANLITSRLAYRKEIFGS